VLQRRECTLGIRELGRQPLGLSGVCASRGGHFSLEGGHARGSLQALLVALSPFGSHHCDFILAVGKILCSFLEQLAELSVGISGLHTISNTDASIETVCQT
jgi:hypothetical protein